MASSTTVYVISGASRGIGFAITSLLAKRENVLIFAGTRNTSKSTQLSELAKQTGGRVIPVKLESANEEDAAALAKLVKEKAGKVDFLIANAGVCEINKPVLNTPSATFVEHFTVNTLGPLILFQQFYSLLTESSTPRFFVTSSAGGATTYVSMAPDMDLAPYGISKAAVNHLVAHIARKYGAKDGLVAAVVHPGLVATDMTRPFLEAAGLPAEGGPGFEHISPDESAVALVKIFDEAKRETHGGKFLSYDGTEIPW
ncbi:putative oxidoreductase [Rhodotorula toruloides]|uniref:Protein of short-chain dehydrogenase/reductase SDR family n=1 Tax=Rhodotorula toruloides TaxID=5286 RepID=A0A2T0AAD4_RHOTO|nr:putative oxidoreductase [Rhodotorula toruloides]PRQ74971.1 hypothetical protein AAT19DRAFT_13993 [Rhodotorula toruloides]